MEDRHIVAIDLGTSKFALTVAKINGEDVQIIYYKETPAEGIRYSYVFNPKKAASVLQPAIEEAEQELNIKITQAVVGMPKYGVRQETNQGRIERNPEECITAEEINDIKRMAQDSYPIEDPKSEELFGAVAQSFSTSEEFQLVENDIIGMASDTLEGNFKIFIGKKNHLHNIDLVFGQLKIAAARKYFTPDSTAKAVLTNAEMESGVALIDFGAGVTSVSIYCGNIMRHYAAIPFGGKSITDDINNECGIFSERLAENIKIAYGACMPDKLQTLSEKILKITTNPTLQSKDLPVKYLSEVITCRVQEITEAILYEIQMSGYADQLRSGIVLTGGGAGLLNCGNFIHEFSGYTVRTGYPRALFSASGCIGVHETGAATSIGMILAAKDDRFGDCTTSGTGTATTVEIEEPDKEKTPAHSAIHEETSEDRQQAAEDGKLFGDSETVVEQPKKPKEKKAAKPAGKTGFFQWGKKLKDTIDDFAGGLYDSMNNEKL